MKHMHSGQTEKGGRELGHVFGYVGKLTDCLVAREDRKSRKG
jgi:hypothetical protein